MSNFDNFSFPASAMKVLDNDENAVILLESTWAINFILDRNKDLKLLEIEKQEEISW